MIDIAELRRLEAEATPGPWKTDGTFIENKTHIVATSYHPENCERDAALIVAMRNALPELLKAVEWQPIETAPKDRTSILVYSPEGEQVAWWSEGWGKFLTTGGGDVLWDEPTHWMPLPLPPHGGGDVGE